MAEKISPQCDLCDTCSRYTVTHYCQTDGQYLCSEHYHFHQKLTTTTSHKVDHLSDESICCHDNSQYFYCKCHNILYCIQCRGKDHTKCEVKNAENYDRDISHLTELGYNILKQLKSSQISMKDKMLTNEKKENYLTADFKSALIELDAAKADLEDKIEKRKSYTGTMLKKNHEGISQHAEAIQNAIEDMETKLLALEKTKSKDKHLEKFQRINQLEEAIQHSEEIMANSDGPCYIQFLKAEHDFEAQNYLEDSLYKLKVAVRSFHKSYAEINKFLKPSRTEANDTTPFSCTKYGRNCLSRMPNTKQTFQNTKLVSEETETKSIEENDQQPYSCCGDTSLKRFSKTYESLRHMFPQKERDSYPSIPIQSQCQMQVKVPGDDPKEQCCITGIASVSNGKHYVMADYRNLKLKLFKSCGSLVDQIKFETNPRDIAKIDEFSILLNFPIAKTIKMVTIENDQNNVYEDFKLLIGDLKIQTEAKCCGIAFHNNRIYVATQMPHEILIMNRDGEIEHRIPGLDLFDRATYIAVDEETSLIYISDPSKKCVLCIDEDRNVKFSYPVVQSHGIACIGNGKLLVADWEIGLHVINEDGIRHEDLKLDRCYCPQKVAFYPDKQMVLVTEWESDIVRTLYLQHNAKAI